MNTDDYVPLKKETEEELVQQNPSVEEIQSQSVKESKSKTPEKEPRVYGSDFQEPTSIHSRFDSVLKKMQKHMKDRENEWNREEDNINFQNKMIDDQIKVSQGLARSLKNRLEQEKEKNLLEESFVIQKRSIEEDMKINNNKKRKEDEDMDDIYEE